MHQYPLLFFGPVSIVRVTFGPVSSCEFNSRKKPGATKFIHPTADMYPHTKDSNIEHQKLKNNNNNNLTIYVIVHTTHEWVKNKDLKMNTGTLSEIAMGRN